MANTFVDALGRPWTVVLNVAALKRVKQVLTIDLLQVLEGSLLERLANDPCLLCDVLFVLCQPQAQAVGVSDMQFGEALAGDVLDQAAQAFLEALVDFFPQARRQVLREALKKLRALESRAAGAAVQRIQSDVADRVLDEELARIDRELPAQLATRLRAAASSGD
jgi:hypothetical protein